MIRALPPLALVALLAAPAAAEIQPYAGQDARDIASLSEDDIAAILAGEGWGLAKPAELNGYPGPAHVLELAAELELTDEQTASVQAIFEDMKRAAMSAGAEYVASEEHLTKMFRAGHAEPDMLAALLQSSAGALSRLREVHLAAHLAVTPLLSDDQKETYARLRGYGGGTGGHEGAGHDHPQH